MSRLKFYCTFWQEEVNINKLNKVCLERGCGKWIPLTKELKKEIKNGNNRDKGNSKDFRCKD